MHSRDAESPKDVRPVGRRRDSGAGSVWPGWLRVLVAVAVVLVFFKIYAGWHWYYRVGSGPGVTFSPTNAYVNLKSALALVVEALSEVLKPLSIELPRPWTFAYWYLAYTLGTVLPASLIGVISFALLTRRFGPASVADPDSRCRRCDYILNGLSQPRCPECGESV